MSWVNKALKRVLNQIVPQYFNVAADDWEPVEGSDGAIKTQVTGSNIEQVRDDIEAIKNNGVPLTQGDANVGRVRTQNKELAMRVFDDIIATIGPENILAFFPLWEESGDFSDLFSKSRKLVGSNVLYQQSGLLYDTVKLQGSVSAATRLVQKPLLTHSARNSEVALNGPTKKIAQKITKACVPALIRFMGCLQGTLATATLKATICADSGGEPGAPITDGGSAVWRISSGNTGAIDRFFGLQFPTPPSVAPTAGWLVLEYADGTDVDASNYMRIGIDTAGGYGGGYALYDGASWTVTANQDLCFEVYADDFVFGNEFSIIFPTLIETTVNDPTLISTQTVGTVHNASNITIRKSPTAGFTIDLHKNISIMARTITRDDMIGNWFVPAVTFNAAADRFITYFDGRVVSTIDWSASYSGEPLRRLTSPLVFGSSFNRNTYTRGLNGKMGPIIITKNTLTHRQVADVTQLLLVQRKLGANV